MKRVWMAAVMTFWLGGVGLAQKAAEPLAVVEVPSMDALQDHLQAYVSTVAPGQTMPAALGFILGTLAKTTNPGLIESSRPVRILFMAAAEHKVVPVLVFTCKAGAAYRSSLLPTVKKIEEKDGVTTYSMTKQDFDRAAFQRATAEERKNFQKFMKTVQLTVGIGEEGATICVGDDVGAVRDALALVRAGTVAETLLLGEGDVNASVNVPALLAKLSTEQGGPFAKLKSGLAGMVGQAGPNPQMMQKLVAIELDAVEAALKQMASGNARLTIDAQNVRLMVTGKALPQTPLAAYLASVPRGTPATLKYLPADSFGVAALRLGDMAPLVNALIALQKQLGAGMGWTPERIDEASRVMAGLLATYGDDAAFALRPGKTISVVQAFRLKDAAAAQTFQQKMPEMMGLMTSLYQSMGMDFRFDGQPIQYGGREIRGWIMAANSTPPANADAKDAEAFAAQQKAMKAVFGDGMRFYGTVIGTDAVQTMGDGALEQIKQTIDGRQQSLAGSDAFRAVLSSLPSDNAGFIHLYLTDLVQWQFSLAKAMTPQGQNQPTGGILDAKFTRGPGLTAVFRVGANDATCNLRLPAAEVKAVVDGIKAAKEAQPLGGAQEKAAPGAGKGKAQPPAKPAPGK